MLSLLQWLVDFFAQLVCWIMTALVLTLNFVIAGLAAVIAAAVALLPDMPDTPSTPAQVSDVAGWINWLFPVSTVADFFAFLLAAWVLWQAVAIGMRWAKAKDG